MTIIKSINKYFYYLTYLEHLYIIKRNDINSIIKSFKSLINIDKKNPIGYISLWQKLIYNHKNQSNIIRKSSFDNFNSLYLNLSKDISFDAINFIKFDNNNNNKYSNFNYYFIFLINMYFGSSYLLKKETDFVVTSILAQKIFIFCPVYSSVIYQVC